MPDIIYEEPERNEDDMAQWPTLFRISGLLYERCQDWPDILVNGCAFVSYDITDGKRRVAPDLCITVDVDVARIYENLPNFWVWEIEKAPDFVMEVASPSTAANDLSWKRELYPQLGIQEHWRFDPTGGQIYGKPITGKRLVDRLYQEYTSEYGADGSVSSRNELLDVVFHWDGEEFDALDTATGMTIDKRAAAEARADTAEARAIFAEDELARLREQLHGQEP